MCTAAISVMHELEFCRLTQPMPSVPERLELWLGRRNA